MEEMQRSYLDYAMSVIVSRALPDVARRPEAGASSHPLLRCPIRAAIAGPRLCEMRPRPVADVLGSFHPHGDASVYMTLGAHGAEFSMRLPLVDGQGNFGSVDGDMPAAMRYTECRMASAATSFSMADIDKDTVDFQPNYDATTELEPKPSCRPGSPTCWSTAPAASPSAWRRTSRRTIYPKSSTAVWPF
jgi:DNA gyrase subunit A